MDESELGGDRRPQEAASADAVTATPSTVRSRLGGTAALWCCAGVMVFAGTEYLAAAFLSRSPFSVTLPVSVLALVGLTIALLVAGAGVYLLRHWRRPTRRLARAIEEALEGALPIDQLPTDIGGLAPLLPALQNVLRELRRQRAEITRINGEMKQKVAQRTDALERQLGQLNAQATRDALTGLYNRRMLDQCFEALVKQSVEGHEPMCLMMIDVDDFKMLNDTLGHAAGDSLLKAIGQLIRSSVRGDDLPFRFGGDEFAVLLPKAGRVEGESLAKRLIDLVDALSRSLAVPRKPRLSMGISTLSDLTGSVNGAELMKDADKRLYAFKAVRKKGRPGRDGTMPVQAA